MRDEWIGGLGRFVRVVVDGSRGVLLPVNGSTDSACFGADILYNRICIAQLLTEATSPESWSYVTDYLLTIIKSTTYLSMPKIRSRLCDLNIM